MPDEPITVNVETSETVVVRVEDASVTAVLIPADQGPAGPQGPVGPPYLSYTHVQEAAAATWTIAHNLNVHPSVTVVDSAGSVVEGEITYLDENTVRVTFSAAFSGRAYLN